MFSGIPQHDAKMFHTFSSASENPRPALTRRLYLMLGQRTIGRSLSTGRGATAAALVRRALRRRDLRPGYLYTSDIDSTGSSRLQVIYGWCQEKSYLIEVGSNTSLPVLPKV